MHRALLPGSRRSRNLTSLLRGEVGALTSSPASRRLCEARVRTGPFSLQPSFGTFAKACLLQAGGVRSKRKKAKAMTTQSKLTFAIAMALSLGLIHSSPTPVKETPLSKSDIVIAEDTSGQDSARMGESSGTKTGSDGQASEGKTGSEKMSQQPSK